MCGTLTYSATFNGAAIDKITSPMKYDGETRTFTIYSDDMDLLGLKELTLSAYLTDYPTVTS